MKIKLILFLLCLVSALSLSAKAPETSLPEYASSLETAVNVPGGDALIIGYGLPAGAVVSVYVTDVTGRVFSSRNRVRDNGTISLLMFLYPGPYVIRAVSGRVTYFGRFIYLGQSTVEVILR